MNEETVLTLNYYEEKARAFCQDTQNVDFSDFQLEFLRHGISSSIGISPRQSFLTGAFL